MTCKLSAISQKYWLQCLPKIGRICMRKQLLPPSHACVVFHTNPCKFWNFLSLTHFRAQIACHKLKGNWALKCLRKYFITVWKFQICKDLYGKPFKRDWVAKSVPCNFYWPLQSLLLRFTVYVILICSFSSC